MSEKEIESLEEELSTKDQKIKELPTNSAKKELTPIQGELDLKIECERDVGGVGMGVLSDGTPFLTGRGLARLLDIENLHVRTISQDWNDESQKPRIKAIKNILAKRGITAEAAHIEIKDGSRTVHAFPDAICLAVLEYYAFDAGQS